MDVHVRYGVAEDLVVEVSRPEHLLYGSSWPPNEALRDRLRTFAQACRLDTQNKQMLWDAAAAFHNWRYERARRSERLTADWLDRYKDDSQWLANIQTLKPSI